MAEALRLLVPSKGRIGEQTLEFFAKCGLDVVRPNSRAYAATLPAVANVAILFQRAWQMVEQVRSGDADAGITGFDILSEMRQEGDDLVVVAADLGYSHGQARHRRAGGVDRRPQFDRSCRSGAGVSGKRPRAPHCDDLSFPDPPVSLPARDHLFPGRASRRVVWKRRRRWATPTSSSTWCPPAPRSKTTG